eukprot:TRINITY_DN30771_c0_g1_i1.p1 TRINITY_DN30771_c0_g1~~TRINITY_DN30771_c0_g1_i1.p1  ORF type:complete len:638 (+),score=96.29 TRINITY_DN30771_c0_g1_i1:113-2026(+)
MERDLLPVLNTKDDDYQIGSGGVHVHHADFCGIGGVLDEQTNVVAVVLQFMLATLLGLGHFVVYSFRALIGSERIVSEDGQSRPALAAGALNSKERIPSTACFATGDTEVRDALAPSNVKRDAFAAHVSFEKGDLVEVVKMRSDAGKLMNGLLGRVASLRGDCRVVVALACGTSEIIFQARNLRKASVQIQARTRIAEQHMDSGKFYNAIKEIIWLPGPLPAATRLQRSLSDGTYSHIVEGRIELVKIPRRGLGYKAVTEIKKGDVLLFDTAFCSTNAKDWIAELSSQARTKCDLPFFSSHVLRMTTSKKYDSEMSQFQALEQHAQTERLNSIVCNNTFQCTREPAYQALFVAAGRFNHSCCANAFLDASRHYAFIRAARDIAVGEEVCLSYVPLGENLQMRRRKMREWSFLCTCARCEAESKIDEQLVVPCQCTVGSFSGSISAPEQQTCSHCCSTCEKWNILHSIQEVVEATKFMSSSEAATADPEDNLNRIEHVANSKFVPPNHSHFKQLLHHTAMCHLAIAARSRDAKRAESFVNATHYLERYLKHYEDLITRWSIPFDLNYFTGLDRIMKCEFESATTRLTWSKKVSLSCMTQFGQDWIPLGLTHKQMVGSGLKTPTYDAFLQEALMGGVVS